MEVKIRKLKGPKENNVVKINNIIRNHVYLFYEKTF